MKKGIVYSLLIMFLGIFCIRLGMILQDSPEYNQKLLSKTEIYVYGFSAPRGRILDVNGKVLVDNVGVKTIYYNKIKNIKASEELEIAKMLSDLIDVPEASLKELKDYYLLTHDNGKYLITDEEYELQERRKLTSSDLNKLKYERITEDMLDYDDHIKKVAHLYSLMNQGVIYSKKEIKKNVTEEEYAKILEMHIPGVTGEITWERTYPYQDTLRNILGNVGVIPKEEESYYLNQGYELTDIVGISYLEKQYEEYLKGTKAKYVVSSDYTLRKIEDEKKGNDLVLSIDIDLQKSLENIVDEKIKLGQNYGNTEYYKDSYVLVSDPKTGEIISLVGRRLNDDNTFSDISLNTLTKSFTIGSAVKGATIAVGYKYHLIEPGAFITDGCVKLNFVPQKCSFKSLGRINDLTALANSSNYYQYLIAIKLTGQDYTPNMKLNATIDHFNIYRNMLASFGLGVKTEIDIPKEQVGIIGKTIADDLLLNLAIGQYDTYTPLEVLQYINSVATGKRQQLSVLNRVVDSEKVIYKKNNKILNQVDLEKEDLERIKEGMKLVLSEGTGKFYVPQGLNFAGKTGTSESFLDLNGDDLVDVATITSTFAGFYPADNPKYSIVVITPNVSHKNGNSEAFYFGASKITKDVVMTLESR